MVADVNFSTATIVKDIFRGSESANPQAITAIGSKVAFIAEDGLTGSELYVCDGTAAGTFQLLDLDPGASGGFTGGYGMGFGSYALFTNGNGGIYATDGTRAGTRHVLNGFAYPVGGRAILLENNQATPDSLFIYDYVANSKTLLTTLSLGTVARPPVMASLGSRFVLGFGSIVVSDGTAAGTFVVSQAGGQGLGLPKEFVQFDGRIYFSASTASTGAELFSIDPQARTARLEVNLNMRNNGADGSSPEALTVYNDTLFFIGNDGFVGAELYKFKNGNAVLVSDSLVSGSAGIEFASLDSTGAGLLIGHGRTTTLQQSYVYRTGSPKATHSLVPVGELDFLQENKRSSVATVPGTSIKLAAFRSPNYPSDPDTLVRIMPDGTYRYFSDTSSSFLMPIDLRQDQIVVAGGWVYFTAGFQDFLWRIGMDMVTESKLKAEKHSGSLFYPNPATGRMLRYKSTLPLQDPVIVNTRGKICSRSKSIGPNGQIDLSGLPSGLYTIQGVAAGHMQAHRIVLE